MNMEQKILVINCNCSKNLDHCGGAGVPVSQFCGREGGSISNPFISFQQSQLFAECNQPQFSAEQKYFSAKYSRDLGEKSAHKYSDSITCVDLRPSSDYWAMRVVQAARAWRSCMSIIWRMTFLMWDLQPRILTVCHVGSMLSTTPLNVVCLWISIPLGHEGFDSEGRDL